MKAVGVIVAITLALALQTTLSRFVIRGTMAVDLGLVVVVYVALTSGATTGLLSGALAGLVQDALSSGVIIGIGGLAKTLVGFLAGVVGAQFNITQPIPRFVVFLTATVLHAVVSNGLHILLDPPFATPYAAVVSQAVGNAVVGVIAFQLVEFLPGMIERRRAQKARIRR